MTNSELRAIYNHVAENSTLNDYQNLEQKKNIRKDINALVLLDTILKRNPYFDTEHNLICKSDKHAIYFDCTLSDLSPYISEEEVKELTLSGVSFSEDEIYFFI
jgi:hypothetical protein